MVGTRQQSPSAQRTVCVFRGLGVKLPAEMKKLFDEA
jgi:hypothetical protein